MREAGVLLPLTSLPGPYGIGTMGAAAHEFVDFLAEAGQSLWQMLPMGPTGHGPLYGDSPYQSLSAFAGNPFWIDLDRLVADGLLDKREVGHSWGAQENEVDYGLLDKKRNAVLEKAAARLNKADPAYRHFCTEHAGWLDDYALYMALKESMDGLPSYEWPTALRLRNPQALATAQMRHTVRLEFWRSVQYLFFVQWRDLHRHARSRGVSLVGDIPIYISYDSADFWAHPDLFFVDADKRPLAVAGVPPDAFSETGQHWGNPLYNWREHRRTRYAWWLARLGQMGRLFDMTRLDHFRALAGYYAIPAHDKTAENGRWLPGPGKQFIRTVNRALPGLSLIAEDLGTLDQPVYDLLDYSGYPGMKVLQFAFDSDNNNPYLPHNHKQHCFVYTGTHDNPPTAAWAQGAPAGVVAFAEAYLGVTPGEDLTEAMVRATLNSVADWAVVPMQDWLGLGAESRVNTPAVAEGNWRWRLRENQLTPQLAQHMRLGTELADRLPAGQNETPAV